MSDSDSSRPPLALTTVNPEDLAAPKGFSHGILAPPGAATLYVAGQIGWDRQQQIVSEEFSLQFRQALRNVARVVAEAGGHVSRITRLTIYVTDKQEYLDDLKQIGEVYREVMGRHYPAMALLEVSALVEAGAKVEIEATAAIY